MILEDFSFEVLRQYTKNCIFHVHQQIYKFYKNIMCLFIRSNSQQAQEFCF